MPVSARLLEVGGVSLFWGFKLLIVAGAAAVLIAAARKVRENDHILSRLTFRLTLVAVQAVTICLACASLSNLYVLTSSCTPDTGFDWCRSQACTQLSHVQPGPTESDSERRDPRVSFNNVATIFLRRNAAMLPPGLSDVKQSNEGPRIFLQIANFGYSARLRR